MQIPTVNPVIQALSGAQEAGVHKPPSVAGRTETARAVGATERSEPSKKSDVHTKREPEDDNNTAPRPRGSMVDIVA